MQVPLLDLRVPLFYLTCVKEKLLMAAGSDSFLSMHAEQGYMFSNYL